LKIITNDSIPLQQKAKGYQQRSPQTRNAWRGSTDEIRDSRLKGGIKQHLDKGYQVLRVREGEVLNDLNNVLRAIEAYLPEEVLNDQSP
jgi:very-short-patch-repair endonuclease